jgi:ATP-dependent RNA helicase RhlE
MWPLFTQICSRTSAKRFCSVLKISSLPVIIGTDALSRGIDVEGIDLVVNYDVPGDAEDYVHRIGRTARAATTGTAITFVNDRDLKNLKSIEQLIEPIAQKELPEELKGIEHVARNARMAAAS